MPFKSRTKKQLPSLPSKSPAFKSLAMAPPEALSTTRAGMVSSTPAAVEKSATQAQSAWALSTGLLLAVTTSSGLCSAGSFESLETSLVSLVVAVVMTQCLYSMLETLHYKVCDRI